LKTIAQIIAYIHNVWLGLPPALQGILQLIVLAVWTLALAYNWVIPGTIQQAATESLAFALAAWAVVFPIIQNKLVPWLVSWFLGFNVVVVGPTKAAVSMKPGYWYIR
jgi:hypothetical protein